MYTYKQTEFDVAVILTRDELHDLKYLLRNYLLGIDEDTDPKFVNRVDFWHSVLSSPVPDASWYPGDPAWLADRDRAIRIEIDTAIADTIDKYEGFDGENRMDLPGFWYGQPDENDEECEG